MKKQIINFNIVYIFDKTYAAIDNPWFGIISEIPGLSYQGKTKEEVKEALIEMLKFHLDFHGPKEDLENPNPNETEMSQERLEFILIETNKEEKYAIRFMKEFLKRINLNESPIEIKFDISEKRHTFIIAKTEDENLQHELIMSEASLIREINEEDYHIQLSIIDEDENFPNWYNFTEIKI